MQIGHLDLGNALSYQNGQMSIQGKTTTRSSDQSHLLDWFRFDEKSCFWGEPLSYVLGCFGLNRKKQTFLRLFPDSIYSATQTRWQSRIPGCCGKSANIPCQYIGIFETSATKLLRYPSRITASAWAAKNDLFGKVGQLVCLQVTKQESG